MYVFLTLFSGVIVTVMTSFNGRLSSWCGTYLATFVIHFVGLITFIIILKIKNKTVNLSCHVPFLFYSGGFIGILTVIFNVISVNHLGVALITALSLLGQMMTSIIIEQTGYLSSIKKPLTIKKALSLIVIFMGIGVMLL